MDTYRVPLTDPLHDDRASLHAFPHKGPSRGEVKSIRRLGLDQSPLLGPGRYQAANRALDLGAPFWSKRRRVGVSNDNKRWQSIPSEVSSYHSARRNLGRSHELFVINDQKTMEMVESLRLPVHGYVVSRDVANLIKSRELRLNTDDQPCQPIQPIQPIQMTQPPPTRRRSAFVRPAPDFCSKSSSPNTTLGLRVNSEISSPGSLDMHHWASRLTQFQCKKCSKPFRSSSELVRHDRVHTGERPFVCVVCTGRFKQRSHLKTHLKRKHSMSSSEADNVIKPKRS
ncbi:hypothetical protein AAMO2058_001171500 [Amorphochlora amoebiformis]